MTTTIIPARPLGRSGIDISEIGTGLWAAGGHWGPTDDAGAIDAIEASLDAGVTFYDTADVYGDGHSERLLGQAMKGRRDRFIVGTKIGWTNYDGDKNRSQYDTVEKLIAGVDEGLKRMGTDYVDLIQCHVFYPEPNTPVFVEGFRKMKEQGKVRAFGVSTADLDHIKTFNAHGDLDAIQIDYSILNRTPEADVFPYCQEHGIGLIVRGPLAMGILTGKFDADDPPAFEGDDFRKAWLDDPDQNAQFRKDLETVERLRPLAADGETLSQLALRFVLANPAVATVIPGARNREQAELNTGAAAFGPLDGATLAKIDAIVPPRGGRKIWPA
ncbi:MAG: aldo/keto reductase [Phycisphaerales bacterium]